MKKNERNKTAQIKELEQRIALLSQKKSRLELVNSLLIKRNSVRGLDNMVEHIIKDLMQTIGAHNVAIVYRRENAWCYRDIYGTNKEYNKTDHPHIDAALASGSPQRRQNSSENFLDKAHVVEDWTFPLLVQDDIIGAVALTGMQLTEKNIFEELQPFFIYASLILDNEIATHSKLAEAQRRMQDSEQLYRTLFEQTPDGIILWRLPELRPVQFNTAAHSQAGYSREEFTNLAVADLSETENAQDIAQILERLQNFNFISFESMLRTKNSEFRHILVTLKKLEISGEEMVLSIHRDISEQKKTEEEMARMNFSLDHISEAVYLIDPAGNFNYVNAEACRSLNFSHEELISMGVKDIDEDFYINHWPEFWAQLKKNKTMKFETYHCSKDGKIFPVEVSANYFEYNQKGYDLALARDISERKQAEAERLKFEQQMMQTQKLESLGVLAGGVAHDFNNLLAAIMGHSELTKRRLPPGSIAIENLAQIEQAAERAADLAKQMLAYSGKGKFVIESIDLNQMLEEMLHMLEVSISKNAVLRFKPYRPLPPINADATQLRQIIMNLVINASEAIGEKSGFISIATGCINCDHDYLKDVWLDENLSDGFYVYLEVADTGCGMTRETVARIFDPFFTTKFTGRGLGMSAVLGIVRGHNGAIKVYSEPGQGTTFKILLPASDKPVELFNKTRQDDDNWFGTGKILLVDDEETVRGIGVEMLKELGFSPLVAADGKEALETYKNTPDINLVILDLIMPKMDGRECFTELKRLNPEVKVIISSGYSESEVTQRFIGKGIAGFVMKPYKLFALKDALKKHLPAAGD